MPRPVLRSAVGLALLASAGAAWAEIDVEVRGTDKVTGTISPASERETVRFRVPLGAVITVKAKALKKGPELHVVLKDGTDAQVGTADGKSVLIKGVVAADSGLFSAEVTSKDGVTTGDYSFSVTWKTPVPPAATVALAAGAETTIPFSADSGAKATFSVKKAKGSAAVPALVSYRTPDLADVALTGAKATSVLAQTGEYGFTLKNTGLADGSVVASVKVKPPRPSKRKIALTAKVIGSGSALGDAAFAAVVGPDGGTVAVPLLGSGTPGAEISGSQVSIPPGALPAGTTIVIGTSPEMALPGNGLVGGGPTVFFGPDGTQFDPAKAATITIPFDPAFAAKTDELRIYTRNAQGRISEVPGPYTFDLNLHTMSVATSHFSSFRVLGPDSGGGPSPPLAITDPEDVCAANDTSGGTTINLFYAVQGSQTTVAALRLDLGAQLPRFETWVGGGTQTADGTHRLQFQFSNAVRSVATTQAGDLYIATTQEIYVVDPNGNVQRVAGTGAFGDTGDNGPALQATFSILRNIVVDLQGNIFTADEGAHRIRQVVVGGNVSAFAGSGATGIGVDGGSIGATTFIGPSDLSFAPGGGFYVADGGRVRHINPFGVSGPVNVTVAGDAAGGTGNSGDGGPALSARFRTIQGLSQLLDFNNPSHDILVVTDVTDHTVRRVNLTTNSVSLLAGTHGVPGYDGDTATTTLLLRAPLAAAAFGSAILICDTGNDRLRTVVVQ